MLKLRTMTAGRLHTRAADTQSQKLHRNGIVHDLLGAGSIEIVDRRQKSPENAQPSKLLQMRVKI